MNIKPHKREIWWVSFGINVGSEQDGRGNNFERPVLIIKRLSSNMYYVLPISTKSKRIDLHKPIVHDTVKGYVLLDQMKAIDKKRLQRKIGKLDTVQFTDITTTFKNLF